ncbi:deoxyribodipyrimidine photo-lyase [Thermomonas sp.]|uniref:cryptochrome/photolyase family protein n=1 Tax=Thermomonas sp. TaxID=1971895 RepID=UPI00248890A4|nr:deoxyribodipyrimidine photo-lyase [Thermomonas sp.]MDI1253398.1 deoxyribodipyrimidine photo-lyase [Thermomonas sp.]
MPNAIVWFRNDLRLNDQPALQAALRQGFDPIPLYIHAPGEEGAWPPGAASNAWRRRSLLALDASLRERGSRLNIMRGPSLESLQRAAADCNAEAVFWNRRYEPAIEQRDAGIKRALRSTGLRVESFNDSLLFEPWQVENKQGDPYRVFTPFWRTALGQLRLPVPMAAPVRLPGVTPLAGGLSVGDLELAPSLHWDQRFWMQWTPGEVGAQGSLSMFIEQALADYGLTRDFPGQAGTSRLSPHLHFGEISPWQVSRSIQQLPEAGSIYLRQLGWRDFAHHVLHHFPDTPESNFNHHFDDFPWADVPEAKLDAWRQGRTGIPIVDAGMRELWETGWMHNRVRMIVASFLTKNLRAHWQHGAAWFWDTLVDADLANNTLGWQWVAGTGVDAAPYIRVFNPVLQSQRFDPDGDYIAHWIPELAGLAAIDRHAPWLSSNGVGGYPRVPIVDLAASRLDALRAFEQVRAGRSAI